MYIPIETINSMREQGILDDNEKEAYLAVGKLYDNPLLRDNFSEELDALLEPIEEYIIAKDQSMTDETIAVIAVAKLLDNPIIKENCNVELNEVLDILEKVEKESKEE